MRMIRVREIALEREREHERRVKFAARIGRSTVHGAWEMDFENVLNRSRPLLNSMQYANRNGMKYENARRVHLWRRRKKTNRSKTLQKDMKLQ